MTKRTYIRIGYHLLFWMTYLFLNGIVVCIMEARFQLDRLPYFMFREAFSLPVKMILAYFIFYNIIPLYLERSKLGKLIVTSLSSFVIATFLYRLTMELYFEYVEQKPFTIFKAQGVILTIFDLYITITSATIIKMIKLRYQSLEFEEQLMQEKLQSELNFLRAQTNPHFLFNTLNNLYVLARKKSDKTAGAIMMLSKIMRFVLYDCRAHQIAIADEAKVIQDYIELEKLRYNDRLTIVYEEELDNPNDLIAPLLLLPFVENSFKHGAHSTTGKAMIHIRLSLKDKQFTYLVENTVDGDEETPAATGSSGIGLKNVQRQLDLIYPGRFHLSNGREDGMYKAQLNINLEE